TGALIDRLAAAPEARRQAAALADWLAGLRTAVEGPAPTDAAATGLDDRIPALVDEVLAQNERLRAAAGEHLRRRARRRDALVAIAAVVWTALVALAATAAWRLERRRRRAQDASWMPYGELLQSQKMEAVGRLAGGLAHDLNNYLAAVRAHCEVARLKHDSAEKVAYKMDRAIRVIHKASTLIERLQTFSRHQPLQLEVVDLRPLIDGMATMLGPSLGEDVRLEVESEAQLWNVEADPAQIEQAIVNLVVNARDALPAGGTIRLCAYNLPRGDGEPDRVVLEVQDDGAGIPPELRDRIFEPFVTTKEDGHSGLGLSIVYAIVSRHGGRIEVDGNPGGGTVVRILLRRSDRPVTVTSPSWSREPRSLAGDEKILLVDDNDDFRESTRALLEELGYRVTAAADGDAGLAACEAAAYDFDLVLADVVMPGLGGRELVERIRRHSDVKAIFMSGHSERVLSRYGIARDEVQVLKGRTAGEDLVRTLRRLLDGAAPPPPDRRPRSGGG
ncbi:MAG: response regulator, partial [Acidobacteria bacterium]